MGKERLSLLSLIKADPSMSPRPRKSLGRINMVQKDSGLNKDGRKRAKFRARGNNGQNKDT